MKQTMKVSLAVCAAAFAAPAFAQVVLYENENYRGRSYSTEEPVRDFARVGFNDRASSVVVLGDRWEACEDARFKGRCIVLQPGRYPSLAAMGMNDRVSSLRRVNADERVDSSRYAPAPAPVYDNHRRRGERLFDANVTSVHAVVGPPEQRCWVEPGQAYQERRGVNVPGAIAGAVIGGILGHQVGGGHGRDVATAGGAVAGAAIGANVGRGEQTVYSQDVQRCENVQGQMQPDYWDVTYNFRGVEHHVQMNSPPGPTLTVDDNGDPRG